MRLGKRGGGSAIAPSLLPPFAKTLGSVPGRRLTYEEPAGKTT
jgi:hypothetical protein